METGGSEKLNRRALLAGAVFLLGGAAALMRFSRDAGGGSGGTSGAEGPVLSSEQFALLEQVSETMVPATDTAGAIAAGVPAFIRGMLSEWGSVSTRTDIAQVLEAIQQLAWSRFGMDFLEMPPDRRLTVLKEFDAARIGSHDEQCASSAS